MRFQIDRPRQHGRLMCLLLVWWLIVCLLSSQKMNLIISRWKRNKGFLPNFPSPPPPTSTPSPQVPHNCVVILQLPSNAQLISCVALFSVDLLWWTKAEMVSSSFFFYDILVCFLLSSRQWRALNGRRAVWLNELGLFRMNRFVMNVLPLSFLFCTSLQKWTSAAKATSASTASALTPTAPSCVSARSASNSMPTWLTVKVRPWWPFAPPPYTPTLPRHTALAGFWGLKWSRQQCFNVHMLFLSKITDVWVNQVLWYKESTDSTLLLK